MNDPTCQCYLALSRIKGLAQYSWLKPSIHAQLAKSRIHGQRLLFMAITNSPSMNWPVCINQYALTSMHWPVCIDKYAFTNIHWPVCIDQYALTSRHWPVCIDQYALTSMNWPVCIDQNALTSTHWSLCVDQYALTSMHRTAYYATPPTTSL